MLRKLLVALFVVALPVIPALAQDAAATPAAATGPTIPVVVGGDVFDRAGVFFNAGEYEQAIIDYSLFILLNPTFSQGYFQRGLSYARIDDLDHALDDLTRALDYPSPSPEFTGAIYSERALVYALQDNIDLAYADLDDAIAAAPDFPDSYYRRGQLYLFEQKFDEALADYNTLLELQPNFTPGYADRAFINVQVGDFGAALADYDHFIELEPENDGAYAARAGLHLNNDSTAAALRDLDNAIRLNPDEAGYYLQRGFVHSLLENRGDAASDYLRWIRSQETRSAGEAALVPGESQILPMEQGLSYTLIFEASAGQHATISVTSRPNSGTDPLIVLLDSAGSPVIADDDGGGNYDAAIQDFIVPADGTYTLVVSHAGGRPDGPVRVLLQLGD